MINPIVDRLVFDESCHILMEADNVAHVLGNHSVMHAAIVLGQISYSRIPVLDEENHFLGTIALSNIIQPMFETSEMDARNINHLKVKDVMDKENIVIHTPINHEEVLHKMVNANFLPVLDEENYFLGIITRQSILKGINRLAHELDDYL